MKEETRRALSNRDSWLRGGSLLLFFLLLTLATPLLILAGLAGWIMLLVQGRIPRELSAFGEQLGDWLAQTARYLTGAACRRPFPFEDLDCPSDEPPPVAAASPRPPQPPQSEPSRPAPDQAGVSAPASAAQAGSEPAAPAAGKKKRRRSATKKTSKTASKKKTAAPKTSPAGRKRAGTKAANNAEAEQPPGPGAEDTQAER